MTTTFRMHIGEHGEKAIGFLQQALESKEGVTGTGKRPPREMIAMAAILALLELAEAVRVSKR